MGQRQSSRAVWFLPWLFISVPAYAAGFCDPTPEAQALLSQYDGLARYCKASEGTTGGIITFYAVPMTEGATPEEAAEAWIDTYAGAIGMTPAQLNDSRNPRRKTDESSGRFTAFLYQQYFYLFPVEGNVVRFLVLNGAPNRVVYVSAWVRDVIGAATPPGEFVLDAQQALAEVRGSPDYAHLSVWSTPKVVVIMDEADPPAPVYAWRFRGRQLEGADIEALRFYVDAFDGSIVRVEDELVALDTVTGVVRGFATPGTLPDVPDNPPKAASLSDVRVRIVETGSSGETDASGSYAILHGGTWPVTVAATLGGQNIRVIDEQGCPILEQAVGVAPPDLQVDFFLNDGPADGCPDEPNEFSTAQINALVQAVRARDFFMTHQPDFGELVDQGGSLVRLAMHVNHPNPADPCNARYAPPDTFYFRPADAECVNMAYSSVVAHEYGHFVVNTLQIEQWSFAEGFADSLSILLHDDPVIGRDSRGPGEHMRDIAASDVPYPCGSVEPHYCGQTLARMWWDLRVRLGELAGDSAVGLDTARRLYTSWALITGGVPPSSAEGATPQTAIEMTVIDDDDGYLDNYTPHVCAICTALTNRNIPCPAEIPDENGDGVPDMCGDDCNGNGIPDSEDIAGGTSFDCNANGVPDECEVPPIGSGPDCNADLVPDECQLAGNDCNGNGVPDECDVPPIGTGPDCNADLVPDECQLAGNDCNDNGVPDECETDCNDNGVPDDCDIAAGTSSDVNGNQIPDECECADLGCYDGDVCTWDRFENGACVHEPNLYGDLDHSGTVSIFDVMAVLVAVGEMDECALREYDITPCEGNGAINVLDVLAALGAIGGIDACCSGNP